MTYVLKSEDDQYLTYFGIRKESEDEPTLPEYELTPSQRLAIKVPDVEVMREVAEYFDREDLPMRVVKLVPARRPKMWALKWKEDGDHVSFDADGNQIFVPGPKNAAKFLTRDDAIERLLETGSYEVVEVPA
jgi:hypothetical protein